MRSHVLTIAYGVKVKKQNKTKNGAGSVLKAKVGELENIKREGRIRRMRNRWWGVSMICCIRINS